MIIFSDPSVSVKFDSEKGIIFQKWTGFTPSTVFRQALDATFDLMYKEKVHLVLSDVTEQKVVAPREQEYTRKAVIEFIRKSGNLKIAFLTKPRSVAWMCLDKYSRDMENEIDNEVNRFFDNKDEALGWLMSQEQ